MIGRGHDRDDLPDCAPGREDQDAARERPGRQAAHAPIDGPRSRARRVGASGARCMDALAWACTIRAYAALPKLPSPAGRSTPGGGGPVPAVASSAAARIRPRWQAATSRRRSTCGTNGRSRRSSGPIAGSRGSMGDRTNHLRERWARTLAVFELRASGSRCTAAAEARAIRPFVHVTPPAVPGHANKRWGVALLRLPDTSDEYLRGPVAEGAPTKSSSCAGGRLSVRARARRRTISTRSSRSTGLRRCARAGSMAAHYVDRRRRSGSSRVRPRSAGSSTEGAPACLRDVILVGDAFVLEDLIGHATISNTGAMYLLVSELVRESTEARRPKDRPLADGRHVLGRDRAGARLLQGTGRVPAVRGRLGLGRPGLTSRHAARGPAGRLIERRSPGRRRLQP